MAVQPGTRLVDRYAQGAQLQLWWCTHWTCGEGEGNVDEDAKSVVSTMEMSNVG